MKKTQSFASSDTFRLLRSLMEAHQEVSKRAERQVAEWGLSASEFDVIVTLGNTEGMRMCDLASKTLNTKSNITRVVKDLAERNLVGRQRNPDCEREVMVSLTERGAELFVETYPQIYQFNKGLFDARLSSDEQRQLTALLQKLSGGALRPANSRGAGSR